MALIGKDILQAKIFLEQSQVVAIPTETVYGLAGNAFDDKAVAKIFQVKNRPTFDPLIVHTNSLDKLKTFVSYFPEKAVQLASAFWPGPLTLVLPRTSHISDLVTSGMDTVGVRIPDHPLTRQLLEILDFPLAAPSANPFGYISPTQAAHVQAQLGECIPYILDGGSAEIGIESTIVGFLDEEALVYRLGGISLEDIERVIGKVEVQSHSTSNPQAPGMLMSHYAPRKPLYTEDLPGLLAQFKPEKIGVLAFKSQIESIPAKNQIILSAAGDFAEAARNLFSGLRKLDALPIQAIFAELLPELELGRAINDRIRRAAAK
ncbi:threonylcarbamoyl-AMP synthase [Rhodocytophaga rosea]|uniref:Threonylcarbamoyl-AMP synthase n=1 Tax=Rhodocytophaga rosea TaxID=2704465 RepID=A0A6C0GNS9_9BACT|nr:L-threonylcarbamoyladenylate synthase [Rhodocytophaga rosea]QHT69686.1 threonylcarbamoyl-AMP synthase [Rhodocytophaga rosea]